MKLRQILTAIAVAMLSLSPAMAQNGMGNGHGGGNGNGQGHQKMAKELGLNQDQMNQLAQLRGKHQGEMQPLQQQMQAIRGKINDLLKAETPDRAAIAKEADKVGELHKQLQEKRVNHLLEIKKVMTKDQWIKFLDKDKGGMNHTPKHSGKGNGCGAGQVNGCKKSCS